MNYLEEILQYYNNTYTVRPPLIIPPLIIPTFLLIPLLIALFCGGESTQGFLPLFCGGASTRGFFPGIILAIVKAAVHDPDDGAVDEITIE